MTRMIFIFLDSSRRQQRVCQVEHRSKQCKRAHSLPKGFLWSGLVPADRLGDFRSDLKLARKNWRRENRKWVRQLWNLRHAKAAPFAKKWVKEQIDKHLENRPPFEFNWKP